MEGRNNTNLRTRPITGKTAPDVRFVEQQNRSGFATVTQVTATTVTVR
jgi:hypothetical protein